MPHVEVASVSAFLQTGQNISMPPFRKKDRSDHIFTSRTAPLMSICYQKDPTAVN
jgi:hypothetical protein